MREKFSLRLAKLLVFLVALSITFGGVAAQGNNDLRIGQRYEIVGELYAHRVANDIDSREVALISLVPLRLSGPEILSRQLVPQGSMLTIVNRAPKRFLGFLYPDRYVVRVNTIDTPAGIPAVIDLSRGIEGKLTPLNPLIFKPLTMASPAEMTHDFKK